MYLEIALIVFGVAMLLLVVFCIPVLLKLWRVANDVTVSLRVLNQRLPVILQNMEEISTRINDSITAINGQIQQYADVSQRAHVVVNDVVTGVELFSPLALKSSVFQNVMGLIAIAKGVRVFFDVLTGRQRI